MGIADQVWYVRMDGENGFKLPRYLQEQVYYWGSEKKWLRCRMDGDLLRVACGPGSARRGEDFAKLEDGERITIPDEYANRWGLDRDWLELTFYNRFLYIRPAWRGYYGRFDLDLTGKTVEELTALDQEYQTLIANARDRTMWLSLQTFEISKQLGILRAAAGGDCVDK